MPYDWVKNLIRHPPEVQRKLDEDEMTRAFNLRFPDDFGRPQIQQKMEDTPAKPIEKEETEKEVTLEDESEKFYDAEDMPNFTGPHAELKDELFKVGGITLQGKVVNKKGKIIQRSNIDDVLAYFRRERKRKPIAVAEVVSLIHKFKLNHEGLQIGSGRRQRFKRRADAIRIGKWIHI